MPVRVTMQIPVQIVKPGDEITVENDGSWPYGATVGTVDAKTKWVVIRDINGHLIRRVEKDTQVRVYRMTPTTEEAAQADRERHERRYQAWAASANAEYLRSVRLLTERLADEPMNSNSAHLFEKVEENRVRILFCRRVDTAFNSGTVNTLYDAIIYVLNDMASGIIRGFFSPSSSGGMNMQNACDAIQENVNRSIIREMCNTINYDMGGILK